MLVSNKKTNTEKRTVLRALREKAALTREQLVSRLDNEISLATWARWETNPSEPSMTRHQWINFCQAVNVDFADLPEYLAEDDAI